MVGANNIEESKTFYDNVLGVLGAKPGLMVPNLTGLVWTGRQVVT